MFFSQLFPGTAYFIILYLLNVFRLQFSGLIVIYVCRLRSCLNRPREPRCCQPTPPRTTAPARNLPSPRGKLAFIFPFVQSNYIWIWSPRWVGTDRAFSNISDTAKRARPVFTEALIFIYNSSIETWVFIVGLPLHIYIYIVGFHIIHLCIV